MSPAQRAARERMLEGLRRRGPDGSAFGGRRLGVSIAKKLLPLVALLLLVALAVMPGLHFGPDANRVSYNMQHVTGTGATSHMQDAKYHGIDQHGEPFTLTANAASDQGPDVALEQPEGDLTLKSGAWLVLKSKTGLFHQKTQMLGLNGDVTLYRNDGTIMTVAAADIDLKQSSASSNLPVRVQGPFGTLNAANGFQLRDHGTDVVFKGPVTLFLSQADNAALPQ